MTTDNEAFRVWFKAYSKNYAGTGLLDSDVIAEQAWLAAINYEREACARIADKQDRGHSPYQYSACDSACAEIAKAIRARGKAPKEELDEWTRVIRGEGE